MSKTYTELYNLWLAFDAAEHFASKTKIAEDIASVEYLDEEVRAMNDILRKMTTTWGDGNLFQVEYRAFVVKAWDYSFTWNGSFNLFFVDEDRLPIDMALNLTEEQVLDAFKGMIVRTSVDVGGAETNADGVYYRTGNSVLSEVSEAITLAAYDFLVARLHLMKANPAVDTVFMRRDIRSELYKFMTE